MLLIILLTVLIASLIAYWLYFRPQGGDITSATAASSQIAPPPTVPGSLFLGSAVSLGKEGADFLYNCKQHYGDAFTLNVVGQKMTFLFDPRAIVHFFKAPETQLAFLPAVEQWTQRVFGLPPSDFIPRHQIILTKMREIVGARASLPGHASRLVPLLHKGIEGWTRTGNAREFAEDWKEIELSGAISQLVFEASVESLFGAKFLERHGKDILREVFFTFESCFELAASPIPHIFQPTFRGSQKILLKALHVSHAAGDFNNTMIGNLIQASEMPDSAVPNMLLAVLWASQANTVPTAFWALGFLLLPENKEYLDTIRASILGQKRNDGLSSTARGLLTTSQIGRLIEMACDSQSLLTKCCMEALRLRSASTDVRIAATDVIFPCSTPAHSQLNNTDASDSHVLIKKGTMVMLCPWISHTDERLFEDPLRFDPNRSGADLPGGRSLHSPCAGVGAIAGVAFGGGKFRCPGRSFAEMELGVAVGLILAGLDVRLSEQEIEEEEEEMVGEESAAWPGDPNRMLPGPDVKKLVGIKVPEGPCYVRIRRRPCQ